MARRKEHDEEMKTARSLVAKMEYEVVEMVMKLWRLMGHLGGKEEEEDDGGGGVVVEMEEEMEENEVVVLVEEMVVEMEGEGGGEVAGQGKNGAVFGCHRWLHACWKQGRRRRKNYEGERRSGAFI